MTILRISAASLAVVVLGCSPPHLDSVRYANAPAVWLVNDKKPVSARPKTSRYTWFTHYADELAFRRISHHLRVPSPKRARDVNALGEVPDSTWFENRIGTRLLTPGEIARGPGNGDLLDGSGPLTVRSSKLGGTSVGFIVDDQRGVRFLIKFDQAGIPVLETATAVVVQRILWAAGYHVPEDNIVFIRREQLRLSESATVKDSAGRKRPMTEADLDSELSKVDRQNNGSYRALASKYLSGVPLGGIKPRGTRRGDPNDVIPHQHRRSLRGLYVLFSWVQNTDVQPGNTLDMWVGDPASPAGRHVMHYLVDFGKSLGVSTITKPFPADGHAEYIDVVYDFVSIFTLGLWSRPWEGTNDPGLVGVAQFDAEHFSPGEWKSRVPWHPFRYLDAYDGFWAAKIVMRFSPDHIRAAVEQGKFTDSRAVDYLVDVLVKRQRKIGAYWFEKLSPLDRFTVNEQQGRATLCFDDLAAVYKLAPHARYRAAAYDFNGRALAWPSKPRTNDGERRTACIGGLQAATDHGGYTIVRLVAVRGDRSLPPVEVHLARGPRTGQLRVVGVNRR